MSKRSGWQVLLLLILVMVGSSGQATRSAEQPPRTADEGFVPIDELPPDERMPAAPFLIAAYAVAWIVVALYLWSIWQRLGRVEREIAEVSRRVERESRGAPGGG